MLDFKKNIPENMRELAFEKLRSGLLESSFLSSSFSFLLLHKTVADSRRFMLSEKNFMVFVLNSGEIPFLVSLVQKKYFLAIRIILSKFS